MTQSFSTPQQAVFLERAEFFASVQKYDQAEQSFQAAVHLENSWHARNEYGRFLFDRGRFAEAFDLFSALMNEARREQDSTRQSIACSNLACLARELGQGELAAGFQQQALGASNRSLLEEAPSPHECMADLLNRANDAILASDLPLAKKLILRVLEWSLEHEQLSEQADAWATLGIVYSLEGRHGDALENLWRAYDMHKLTNEPEKICQDLINLALPFQQAKQPQEAVRVLTLAIDYLRRLHSPHLLERARLLLEEAEAATE